ncbi:MAG TPA: type II secretion system protein [bacterium]|nr:type II secretion system protein [bacterium]
MTVALSMIPVRGESGFSLLEVTVAIAILAGLLISMARIVSHSYYYTERVADIYLGTELARLKMHEIEEEIKKDGIPTADKEDEGDFDEQAYEGFKWHYSIKRVHIPLPDVSGSDLSGVESGQAQAADLVGGAKSMIEDFIKEKIRKLTLEVFWDEGKKESEKVTFVMFIPADTSAKEFQQGGAAVPGAQQRPGGGQQKWFNSPTGGGGLNPATRGPAFRPGTTPLPAGGPR